MQSQDAVRAKWNLLRNCFKDQFLLSIKNKFKLSSMNLLLAIVLLHYVWFFDCSLLQQTAQRSISDFQFHAKLCNLLVLFRLMYYYFAYFISYFICYSYDLTVKYWGSISPLNVVIFILGKKGKSYRQPNT